WLLFAWGVVAALSVFNAYIPIRYTWVVGPSFLWSWLVIELAPHQVVWQPLIAAVFVWFGALHAWPGWVGLALIVVCELAVVGLIGGSLRTRRVFDDALRSGLGDYTAATNPAYISSVRWLAARELFLPWFLRDHHVRATRNIDYGASRGKRNQLDIYAPRNGATDERRPVLVWIHGGGWTVGEKRSQGLPMMLGLARRGWVCVAPNYRLSPRATWPDHLVDVKEAIAWVKAHIHEFGGEPSFVVVAGGSAGGHLAAMVALTANEAQFQPGFESVDTSVVGCVPFYGVFDFSNRSGQYKSKQLSLLLQRFVMHVPLDDAHRAVYEEASPIAHVRADAPPFLVIAGTLDSLVPVADSALFVDALRAVSEQPVCYAVLPGAQHAFEVFHSIRTAYALEGLEHWLAWLRTTHAPTP
ncbi:MAG: alpha/beta hydrolase fold domain-containing protein, partial [Acidimicrobiia bacterium]